MTRSLLVLALSYLAACAGAPACPPPAQAVATFAGPPARALELPTPGAAPREVKTLVAEPALKLVAIALRAGTELPEHHADVPVTIVAAHGSGVVIVGSDRLRLDPDHPVALAAGVAHAVTPDAGSDLVLLVHHLGHGPDHGRAP